MDLPAWRCGKRRAWTSDEVRILRECVDAGMGPAAIWRSGRLPARSEGSIRAQVTKRGWWGTSQPRFDGERRELSVWVTPMMKARLRQRAQRDGIALSELVRRACARELASVKLATWSVSEERS